MLLSNDMQPPMAIDVKHSSRVTGFQAKLGFQDRAGMLSAATVLQSMEAGTFKCLRLHTLWLSFTIMMLLAMLLQCCYNEARFCIDFCTV